MKRQFFTLVVGALIPLCANAESRALTANEIAAEVNAAQTNGASEIRMRMQVEKPSATIQIRIRERRTPSASDVVYEILWPKERAGEAVFLHQAPGKSPTGAIRTADGQVRNLSSSDMDNQLLGSDLAIIDAIESFYAWRNQSLAGREEIDNVNCVILDSKPRGGSIYGRIRSWIDPHRMVPLRVEKYYPSGKLARRIETTRVVPDAGHQIPADLTITNPSRNSKTTLDGSSIRHKDAIPDSEFSPQ